MAIQPEMLLAYRFPPARQQYTARDAILYALGVGLGSDPVSPFDLAFLDETQLSVLPTFAVTLGSPGMWIRDPQFGVNFGKLVHSEQAAIFHKPLPPSDEVESSARIVSLTDRGEGRGAVLVLERVIASVASGAPYCTLQQTLLLRGDGGFGGPPASRLPSIVPDRTCDTSFTFHTSSRAALIYRLSGDWNPLHIDPATARRAGFDRPIMQGLGSYGMVAAELCRRLKISPIDLRSLSCHFSGIVTPGDDISIDIWQTEMGFIFTGKVGDRIVLDQGLAGLSTN